MWKRLNVNLVRCPVCASEHRTWTYMSTHMILKGCGERMADHVGDDPHARYVDVFTGKDRSFWGTKHDAYVGHMMKTYHKRHRRLPTLQEL